MTQIPPVQDPFVRNGEFFIVDRKALTLIEILVAALILAIVMAGLVNVYIASRRYVIHARLRMTGGELGRSFLEPLRMEVRQDSWGSNCLSNSAGCPSSETIDNIGYNSTYNINDVAGTNLRRVTVSIAWTEPNP